MTFPSPAAPPYNFQSELGTSFGTHLDANFDDLTTVINALLRNLQLIQRDDGDVRNQTVHADAFTSDALALMAGSSVADSSLDWRPRGDWLTATLYDVGNIVQTGSPAVSYVCSVQHVSGTFAPDLAAGKWVVLSSPREFISADITAALGYTPVNRAGDTMTGALVLVTGSKIGGSSGMIFTDTLLGTQDLITVNKGLYSAYESTKGDIVYGFAANVVRSAGAFLTVGSQSSAIGTSGAGASLFGANFNAVGLSGFASPLVGMEIDVGSFTPGNQSNKYGLNLIFFNRGGTNPGEYNYVLPSGTYTSTGGGLGDNYYNKNAKAIVIESQERSATGEACGWTRGIAFGEYSLDVERDAAYHFGFAYPIGIDFSAMHYYGGTNPVTAFNQEAAIALRDFQVIWWNRDPATAATATNKVKTYFNPSVVNTSGSAGRWVIANAGAEVFGVDITTGQLYQGGVVVVVPSLTANNTWTGTNTFNQEVKIASSNLVITGLGRRIISDFSNPTVSNRTMIQTSAINSATEFGIIPQGTAGVAAVYVMSNSNANNCQVGRISVDSTQFQIAAGVVGTATHIPMTFGVAGLERIRIDEVYGQVIVNATVVTNIAARFRVNGIIQCDNPVAFSAHCNGVNFNVAVSTPTVAPVSTEVFDTNFSFDTTPGRYWFKPPAGTYALTGVCNSAVAATGVISVSIYKNGAQEKSGNIAEMGAGGVVGSTVTCIVQANGTTDYFQLVVNQVTGGILSMSGLAADTYFQGWRIG